MGKKNGGREKPSRARRGIRVGGFLAVDLDFSRRQGKEHFRGLDQGCQDKREGGAFLKQEDEKRDRPSLKEKGTGEKKGGVKDI